MTINYLTVENILAIHDRVIEEATYSKIFLDYSGGEKGIAHLGNLENTISRVQYSVYGIEHDIFTKSAILLHGINCGHCFTDGNKRTAYMATWLFLRDNGYKLRPNIDEAEELLRAMAMDCSKYSIKRVRGWILRNIERL